MSHLPCRHVAFVAGGLFAVLVTLTVIQEQLLSAPHMLVAIGALGLVATVCRLLLPEEVCDLWVNTACYVVGVAYNMCVCLGRSWYISVQVCTCTF